MRDEHTRGVGYTSGGVGPGAGLVWDCDRFSKQARCAVGVSDADRTATTTSAQPNGAWRRRALTTASYGEDAWPRLPQGVGYGDNGDQRSEFVVQRQHGSTTVAREAVGSVAFRRATAGCANGHG